jgi:hypothetical protein
MPEPADAVHSASRQSHLHAFFRGGPISAGWNRTAAAMVQTRASAISFPMLDVPGWLEKPQASECGPGRHPAEQYRPSEARLQQRDFAVAPRQRGHANSAMRAARSRCTSKGSRTHTSIPCQAKRW